MNDEQPGDRGREAETFNNSLQRCTAAPQFLDAFYRRFLASSPEVAEKFKHTDFARQKLALKGSLWIMMMADQQQEIWRSHIEQIARRHSRSELDIRPELYDLWLDCLMQTVAEFDPQFGPEVEAAWREILGRGIALMKARY